MIIVDGPPVIPVGDTLRLAQLVDGVILVVRTGKTSRKVVKRAIDMLKSSNCKLLGVALNDLSSVLPYYYQKNIIVTSIKLGQNTPSPQNSSDSN